MVGGLNLDLCLSLMHTKQPVITLTENIVNALINGYLKSSNIKHIYCGMKVICFVCFH